MSLAARLRRTRARTRPAPVPHVRTALGPEHARMRTLLLRTHAELLRAEPARACDPVHASPCWCAERACEGHLCEACVLRGAVRLVVLAHVPGADRRTAVERGEDPAGDARVWHREVCGRCAPEIRELAIRWQDL